MPGETRKRKAAALRSQSKASSAEEIVLVALLQLGGESTFVDCEDIAYRAHTLAPGRFSWVKYPDQINIHTIKTTLWFAKGEKTGALVLGSDRQGWMLTEAGQSKARASIERFGTVPRMTRKPTQDDRWRESERTRLLGTDAYRKLAAKGARRSEAVTMEQAEAFFRLNAYVVDKARANKIQRLLNAFGDDPELGPVVRLLAETIRRG